MDWKDIAGTVGKVAPALGMALGGPLGGAIGAIAASALGVDGTPDAVAQAVSNDPEAAIKLRQVELEHQAEITKAILTAETEQLVQVNTTMRAELVSGNWFQKGWRPMFGYGTALSYTAQMLALSYIIVDSPEKAPAVIAAMAAMTGLWAVGLAVVGVAVWKRSSDKQVMAGGDPAQGFGLIGAAAKRLFPAPSG